MLAIRFTTISYKMGSILQKAENITHCIDTVIITQKKSNCFILNLIKMF